MEPIDITNGLSLLKEELEELIVQYQEPENKYFKYQKIFQYITSPYSTKRYETKYHIEIIYDDNYGSVENWRHEFLDKLMKLFRKYENIRKLGLLKKKVMFYANTIIKITIDHIV